jgi:hypothetical protein
MNDGSTLFMFSVTRLPRLSMFRFMKENMAANATGMPVLMAFVRLLMPRVTTLPASYIVWSNVSTKFTAHDCKPPFGSLSLSVRLLIAGMRPWPMMRMTMAEPCSTIVTTPLKMVAQACCMSRPKASKLPLRRSRAPPKTPETMPQPVSTAPEMTPKESAKLVPSHTRNFCT